MSIEFFYAPVDEVRAIPLDDLIGRLSRAGLTCAVEPDSAETCWVVFEGSESALFASVAEGHFVGGTFQVTSKDDPAVIEGVDAVLREAGYSSDEESATD